VFEIGGRYNRRRDLHDRYGGQQQGGISTPKTLDAIFLFTGSSGEAYGYRDEFRPDGVFWYTGEGQSGDMRFVRGNRAIRDHVADGKQLLLFEAFSRDVRFIGEATCIGYHTEQRPDVQGSERQAIVFELDLESSSGGSEQPSPLPVISHAPRYWGISLPELRGLATMSAPSMAPCERRMLLRCRSDAVRVYVLRRSAGICEACGRPAPFFTKAQRPYLEPHHILRLCDGGPDDPRHVAAVCPNCHREAHYGCEAMSLNDHLLKHVGSLELEAGAKSGHPSDS